MKTILVAAAWWYLVSVSGTPDGGTLPRAIGPFASKELCRQAGANQFPDDERFYDAAKLAQVKKERELALAARKEQDRLDKLTVLNAWTANGRKAGSILIGSSMLGWNDAGEINMWGSVGGGSFQMCPCFKAISRCQLTR